MPARTVGVIGAGQLARMMGESASSLGVTLVVLAEHSDDAATAVAARTVMGTPFDESAVRELARQVEVITLDHELVDLDLLRTLTGEGVTVHPSPDATQFAARKDHQRATFAHAGVPVPRHSILTAWNDAAFDEFTAVLDAPPVVKAIRGGYDGRGVVIATSLDDAREAARTMLEHTAILLEERVTLRGEVAVVVVTSSTGERRQYPVVRTIQHDGLCTEVLYPCGFSDDVIASALAIADQVADLVGAVGVLAVELFVTPDGVVLNEVATRPHNSGHWTIEGAVTSQFENHLRAVLGLPLGATTPTSDVVVMVNVVGAHAPGRLEDALRVDDAHVHDYGKHWRPGRKLGHVTVTGSDRDDVRVRAWESAEALGTVAPKESL